MIIEKADYWGLHYHCPHLTIHLDFDLDVSIVYFAVNAFCILAMNSPAN